MVTREPEFDDYTRSRIFALMQWESRQCSTCGNVDSLVPLKNDERNVAWPDGRTYVVEQFRCLACGAADLVRRDFQEAHKDDKPVKGVAAAGDGRRFVARPVDKSQGGS